MKLSNKRSVPLGQKTALITAILMSLSTLSTPAMADRKPIGDLEIYKAAEGGKVTIMMMLDTSGSMSLDQVNYACDLPSGTYYIKGSEASNTNPSYIKNYCETGRRYYYRLNNNNNRWYRCGPSNGSGSTDYGFSDCGAEISAVSVAGFGSITSNSNNTYFYKFDSKTYDRLTRLKDAIFDLMDNTQLDSEKVAIGIGQFSTQSNSNNQFIGANGRSGKILVPAALLTDTQRRLIKTEVAGLIGSNGTPTANAYAEAGAYMLGTNTVYLNGSGNYSGFDESVNTSKKNGNYISPLSSPSSCDGRGIYFLTDGNPNSSPDPARIMRTVLKDNSFSIPSDSLPSGSEGNNGMPAVGAFARVLRDPTKNLLGADRKVYTAVVGFGSDFNVDRVEDAKKSVDKQLIRTLSYTNPNTGATTNRDFYNCKNFANVDARNACNWGEKTHPSLPGVGGFGEGGFYSAQSTNDIVNSITTFVNDLDQTLPAAPSGTITVPDNPYQVAQQLPFAYLPMLAADVASNLSIWDGNLKKYSLNQGTLYGKNNSLLFKSAAGDLRSSTQDLWQNTSFSENGTTANDSVQAGGVYAQLATPRSGLASVRSLYVEDYTSANDKTPILRRVGVSASGTPSGFDALVDTATYTELNKRRLLSFLGFDGLVSADGLASSNTRVSELTLSRPTTDIRILGGVVHSKPTAISYSATLDENGRITNTRDDYVLFGSMDGALHLVDADDGSETTAIIPKYMLEQQPKALVKDSTVDKIGQPYFGVDAPWLVTTDYSYDLENSRVTVDTSSNNGMFAYGGLRMGGNAFYGMDISDAATPRMLFTITPSGLNYSPSTDFSRMGQIWSKPTAAKVRLSADADPIDVLVFGGGYDMQYENDSYKATSAAPAKGNAVYMINARTGELIWSTSGEAGGNKNKKTDTMINSIVGGITVLDRDNDGLMDHLYAADLGGQVFRADFKNARPAEFGFTEVNNFSNTRVVRILNTNSNANTLPYRFYERPVISFYRNEGIAGETVGNAGQIFAMVNVISGNRSAPLSRVRTNNSYANRVYGIIDNDITQRTLYDSSFSTTVSNLTESDLVNLTSTLGDTPTAQTKQTTKNTLIRGTKRGWYYPLTRFDGYQNVKYNKGVGDSVVINSLLYTTVYNPDKLYGATNSCSAKIQGGSERQLYCLPYGICTDESSITGTGGYVPAGQGIQELTLGAYNENNTDIKVLIGTTTINERADSANRTKYGTDTGKNDTNIKDIKYDSGQVTQTGGDGSAVEYLFNERYTLQPKKWYEKK
ncbi:MULTISPECIES: PilC/PilY family type IV pilus protein [unclassified Psychrobacter]|uniref:PilC/PilY family type IV pilus protein n=1 Tax=unclassified Psychrobacter TaxID=196806 RepID=UPI0018F6211D|nr:MULTISPECIES: PilC/PilY family type IV pilus protein [unclassified Psychrobacter]